MKVILILLSMLLITPAAYAEETPSTTSGDRTVIEGVLTQVSSLPTAETNPYPDCYYTATIEILHIVSGPPVPRKVALVLPGFFSRRYAPESKLRVGEKVRAVVVPFSSMPEKVRQTQQADEIDDVELEFYYPKQISPISEFQPVIKPINFRAKENKAEAAADLQLIDVKAQATRRESMKRDLDKINTLLAEHSSDWGVWYQASKPYMELYKKEFDAKSQKWVGSSFFSAGYLDAGKIFEREFVKSVIFLRDYLRDRNIDLILVRVPQKGEVVDDLFTKTPQNGVSNPNVLRLYKELLDSDVEIVTDVIERAKADRFNYTLTYWYQDFSEAHPAEGMSWILAKGLAERVGRYNRVQSVPKKTFSLTKAAPSTRNFKWPEGNPNLNPTDYVNFSAVTDENGKFLQLKQGIDSPILMMGSSFIAYPSLDKGGSVPHYFAYLTGIVPDLLHRSGGDRTMFRNLVREGDDLLRGKAVVLFPFVPETALTALTPPPSVNMEKSEAKLIATLSGPSMRDAIELSPEVPKEAFSYSTDGALNIHPVKAGGAAGKITMKLPDPISRFQYFCLEIDFASKDTTNIIARYADQRDTTLKSNDQIINVEKFTFLTKPERSLEVEFQGNPKYVRTISIKKIKFYGISKPVLN